LFVTVVVAHARSNAYNDDDIGANKQAQKNYYYHYIYIIIIIIFSKGGEPFFCGRTYPPIVRASRKLQTMRRKEIFDKHTAQHVRDLPMHKWLYILYSGHLGTLDSSTLCTYTDQLC
jgi:hypothetical protein